MLNLLKLFIVLWLCKRTSLVLRYTLKYLGVKGHGVCNLTSKERTRESGSQKGENEKVNGIKM